MRACAREARVVYTTLCFSIYNPCLQIYEIYVGKWGGGGTQSRQNFPEVGPDLKLRRGGIAVGAAAAAATGALAGGGRVLVQDVAAVLAAA